MVPAPAPQSRRYRGMCVGWCGRCVTARPRAARPGPSSVLAAELSRVRRVRRAGPHLTNIIYPWECPCRVPVLLEPVSYETDAAADQHQQRQHQHQPWAGGSWASFLRRVTEQTPRRTPRTQWPATHSQTTAQSQNKVSFNCLSFSTFSRWS